ncbi:hypothetical protein GGR50DRAFT_670134 [Xylaria sp. CBS 124048]|nr:hypothetical protein GGR50DRAFT_670134 [Xylaria sp. CBS 124048]
MGFLNFLSKKPQSGLEPDIKTCSYDTTVAAPPPIRGTYPVPGNGAKILEEFQKSHPDLAAAAVVSSASRQRSRGDLQRGRDLQRPRTAPSRHPRTGSISSLRSQSTFEMPPIPTKRYGPYKLPPRIITDLPSSPGLAKSAPFSGLASPYSPSVRSGVSGKLRGHIDLLDAQSKIKPHDFYGRIQATGARHYGEDVAERNRADAKGLGSTTVQELYRSPADTKLRFPFADSDESDEEIPIQIEVQQSLDTGLRSPYTRHKPDLFPPTPSKPSVLSPDYADEVSKAMDWATSEWPKTAARPTSAHSSWSSTSSETEQRSSRKSQSKEKAPEPSLDFSNKGSSQELKSYEREYAKPNISKRQPLATPHTDRSSRLKLSDLDKPLPALPPSAKDQTRRQTISHASMGRQSFHSMRTGNRGKIHENTNRQTIALHGTRSHRDGNAARYQLGSTTNPQGPFHTSPAQQCIVPTRAKRTAKKDREDESTQSISLRKRSVVSLSSKSATAPEIEKYIPQRTSSLRHWSLTSETAMSIMSSNPFRPQSAHSTCTSVDSTPMFPFAPSDPSIPPVPDIPILMSSSSSPITKKVSQSRLEKAAYKRRLSEFFQEDDASSDDNDSIPSSRDSYEKEPLFVDTGYGESGPQFSALPGLFDIAVPDSGADPPKPATSKPATPKEPRNEVTLLRMPAYFDA